MTSPPRNHPRQWIRQSLSTTQNAETPSHTVIALSLGVIRGEGEGKKPMHGVCVYEYV